MIRRRSLKLINRVRTAAGCGKLEDLPQGVPDDFFNCVIARALAPVGLCSVSYNRVETDRRTAWLLAKKWRQPLWPRLHRGLRTTYKVRLPWALERLVIRFDNGKYGSLVDPAAANQSLPAGW